MHNELGISYDLLESAAAHMSYWKMATIITKISEHSIFTVSPSFTASDEDVHEYISYIQAFSFPRFLKEHNPPIEIDDPVLVRLLKKQYIIENHMYLLINIS